MDAMDKTVRVWMANLLDDRVDDNDVPLFPLEVKERLFKRCEEYLLKRQKLFPNEGRKEGAGVTSMRQMLKDPEFEKVLAEMGYQKVKPASRAPSATARDRGAELAQAAEGSALHAAVFEGEGLEGVTTDV